jgi:uncharacterized protein YceK
MLYKSIFAIAFATALSGCASVADLKTPENAAVLRVPHHYTNVHRIVTENSRRCMTPQQVVSAIYPEIRGANITEVSPVGVPHYAIDIRAISDDETELFIYPGFEWMRTFLPGRITNWLSTGSTKCKFEGKPAFGPD